MHACCQGMNVLVITNFNQSYFVLHCCTADVIITPTSRKQVCVFYVRINHCRRPASKGSFIATEQRRVIAGRYGYPRSHLSGSQKGSDNNRSAEPMIMHDADNYVKY